MRFKMDFSALPKCGARPKKNSTRTHPCRHIALANGRCYYHQGRPATHGYYTKTASKVRRQQKEFIKTTRTFLSSLEEIIDDKIE